MNPVDLVFGIFILVMAIKGVIKGFVKEIFGLLALLCGIFFAHNFHAALGLEFVKHITITKTTANIAAFFIIFFAVYIVTFFIGLIISSMLRKIDLGFLDRVFGFTFGVAKAMLVMVVIVLVFESFSSLKALSESLQRESYFYSLTEKIIYSTDMIERLEQVGVKRSR